MRKIERYDEPDFWIEYKRRNTNTSYDDLQKSEYGISTRRKLREHLIKSQYYLCAYCCKRIDVENSLNEHIKPKGDGKYSRFSMNYDNIVASCKSEGKEECCSAKKKDKYDEFKFISPLMDGCEAHFNYLPTGEIEGTTDEGEYTCELLGLNNYSLRQARKAQIKVCEAFNDEALVKEYYLTDIDGKLEPYADCVDYFYKQGYFGV